MITLCQYKKNMKMLSVDNFNFLFLLVLIFRNKFSLSGGENALLIMLFFIFFAYNVFKKIRDTNDNVFKMILLGLISLLMMQAFVHVGVNLRVLPTTGMTLPYLSYGGSSIISISIISGIILNLTKRRVY